MGQKGGFFPIYKCLHGFAEYEFIIGFFCIKSWNFEQDWERKHRLISKINLQETNISHQTGKRRNHRLKSSLEGILTSSRSSSHHAFLLQSCGIVDSTCRLKCRNLDNWPKKCCMFSTLFGLPKSHPKHPKDQITKQTKIPGVVFSLRKQNDQNNDFLKCKWLMVVISFCGE